VTSTSHGAADSAVGYLYQIRWALLELLRGGKGSPDAAISLELHDDVAWEEGGTPAELLSLKHHRTARALTDASDDLWRTLRVWRDSGTATDPDGPRLVLVTTSTAADGTAAAVLGDNIGRDEPTAIARLTAAAAGSTAQGTAEIRAWFNGLADADRQVFVSKIVVADMATPIADVRAAVRTELWWALPTQGAETFLDLLWSWWEAVALDMLQRRRGPVSRFEAQDRVADLRDRFAPDNLPTVIELADVDEDVVVAAHDERLFVAQMQWVRYTRPNLRRAIVDYHRAVEHMTRWLADDLIGLAELRRFEDDLRDEWARAFDDMIDDLGVDADEDAKMAAGKELLRRLLDSTAVTVRSRYNDRFFARGKRHELADMGQAGWHPDFRRRVEALLTAAS
jgi:C-terminal domain 7 of the ABC-three component (ABC-3C) systems